LGIYLRDTEAPEAAPATGAAIIVAEEGFVSYRRFYHSGRPLWRSDVQIRDKLYLKSYMRYNPRHPHPYATAEEIAAQRQLPVGGRPAS
jgi:hypothetical protein